MKPIILDSPITSVLYKVEQAIKEYRRLCQSNIDAAGIDITVDQGLVLMMLHSHKELSQVEIGKKIFKDNASVTRILKLMVGKGYIHKELDNTDKRRSRWLISPSGANTIAKLKPAIEKNRESALRGLEKSEIFALDHTLEKIIYNCQRVSE